MNKKDFVSLIVIIVIILTAYNYSLAYLHENAHAQIDKPQCANYDITYGLFSANYLCVEPIKVDPEEHRQIELLHGLNEIVTYNISILGYFMIILAFVILGFRNIEK